MNALVTTTPPEPPEQIDALSGLTLLPKSVARGLAADSANRELVLVECEAAIRAEQPAALEDFALIIERLALHYPENRLTPGEQKLVLRDWRRLMGHLPEDILRLAADAYVMTPARFFPTPGQLKAHADELWTRRQILAKRARETLEIIKRGGDGET